ncbi:MAG: tyrosine-type recombinase/integrase [Isosphaeraceae bacterium]
MANLGRKGDLFVARFRYGGKEFKRSLKTTRLDDARAALGGVERTLHGLATGLVQVPPGVDPGDFILSCGTLRSAPQPKRRAVTLRALVDEYLGAQSHKAPSSVYTEGVHLRNLLNHLGAKADRPADAVLPRDLEQFLQARLKLRSQATVHKERDTTRQLFDWAVGQGLLAESPASRLTPVKGETELPPFRTVAEIEAVIARGGLNEAETHSLWDNLYLNPQEIAALLGTVRARATTDYAFLLHAIPAYTGLRRGEVLRLRWTDVELTQGYVVARSRKQSRRAVETHRRVDLHPELSGELTAWQASRPRGQYVVGEDAASGPLDVDAANRAFWQPMRGTPWCLNSRRNWFKIGFHTYRHSFASNLAAAGVDQRVIDEFLGHSTEAMRRRYRHLFPRSRRSAIESFSLAPGSPDQAG